MKSIRGRKPSARAPERGLSRREFARGATVAAAAMAALPSGVLGAAALATPHGDRLPLLTQESPGEKPKLSAQALAEVEAKVAEIFRRYGDRLNEEQKTDIRRLVREAQPPLETLRAYSLENSDEPATILHLVRAAEPARASHTPRAALENPKRPGA